ncbi:excinuclease ABC subunit B [Sphingomonas panacisoli]|uniref:Excinuclease ABC subunit B n=1 Tax=Sphingomonas panacisoli TaxID=1813879 RepID=A0A5B8LGM1_9SPHN|nr:UvrB/UvrC motif-containing protein [Sphingomonas panacisoli]QDZ06804.1 excinuclease ABC subunit B [Sphingomonas panacisoli]
MSDLIAALMEEMAEAAAANDFERATDCRDRIALLRGGAEDNAIEDADLSGVRRPAPGAMGLGTSQPRIEPPIGWRPPPKPDPMTAGQKRRGKVGSACRKTRDTSNA